MQRKRLVGSVAAAATAVALATGGAALAVVVDGDSGRGLSKAEAAAAKQAALVSVPKVDFSKRASIVRHLRSLGIDPRAVVFQRGKRNYAGPNCPGRAWNCTTATMVVQLASHKDGENHAVCKGEGAELESPNKCVIVQGSLTESGNNHAVCIMKSHSPDATQSCEITQSTADGRNHAIAHESVENTFHGPASEQHARQEIQITQTAGSGRNIADWRQDTKFISHAKGGGTQAQDVHQVAFIDQISPGTADSDSNGRQSHNLVAHAQGGAVTHNQNQKPSPFDDCHPDTSTPAAAQVTEPNSCAVIHQTSGSGRLSSRLIQDSDLDSKAKTDTSITVNQGAPAGGLDYGIDQHSTGLATFDHDQYEDFDAKPDFRGAIPLGAVFVHQEGPLIANGSPPPHQSTNPDDRADINQVSRLHVDFISPDLIELGAVVQNSALGAFYVTTGTAFLHQLAETNTGFYEEEAEGSFVTGEVRCIGTEDDDDDGPILLQESEGTCAGFTTGSDEIPTDTTDTGDGEITDSIPTITIN